MNWGAIPEHEQLARKMLQQVFEKTYYAMTPIRTPLYPHEQPSVRGQCADRRQMIAGQRHMQDRRLPTWRVRADPRWQQVEAGLVYPHDGLSLLGSVCLRSGQRSSHHAWITVSSRCVARTTGFCTLKPKACNNRLTCARWYVTPRKRLIRAATRLLVQTSPMKPKAWAPWANNAWSSTSWSADKRGFAPGGGGRRSPASPPSRDRKSTR